MTTFLKSRWSWVALMALASLPLMGWWTTGLFDLDEGYYAAVAGEMLRRGEWITPYYNGEPWYEKPILLYWLAIPSIAWFGQDFGPRLPSVLATLTTYGMTTFFVNRHFGKSAAFLSTLVLASSLLMVVVGRMMMTDPLLVMAFTAAMFAFWESLSNPRLRYLVGLSLGLAVLAKGPVAVILFALVAAVFYWRQPALRAGYHGGWWLAAAVFLAVVASWYVPAYLKDGQVFVQEFLVKQNLGRFAGGDEAHTIKQWWGYLLYFPILLIGMFPWSLIAWLLPRLAKVTNGPLIHFLAIWAIAIFAFFTVSQAKLPHYILPCLPPLAIVIGVYLASSAISRKALGAWPAAWILAICVVTNVGFASWYLNSGQRELHDLAAGLKNQPDTVIAYQMTRRNKALGTGSTQIQETSHPSLAFYVNRTILESESLGQLFDTKQPIRILTRKGRLTETDVATAASAGFLLEVINEGDDHYQLWRLEPLPK